MGTILISVALGPEGIGRYPWHMPRDRCAQPFPFTHCILEPCTTQQLWTPTILESFVDGRPMYDRNDWFPVLGTMTSWYLFIYG